MTTLRFLLNPTLSRLRERETAAQYSLARLREREGPAQREGEGHPC